MFIDAQLIIGAATLLLAIFTVLVNIVMKIAKIEAQVLPSGSYVSDKVNEIETRVSDIGVSSGE
jgi:hypothetical protein